MSIQQVQTGYASALVVRLLDGSNNPVVGVPYTAVTVVYQKQGAAWVTKSVLASDWSEGPEGRYSLVFSAAELGTDGRFMFRVSASGANTFTGDVDLVSDWATAVDMLEYLINSLNTKVAAQQTEAYKALQDEALQDLDARYNRNAEQINIIKTQIATLFKKVSGL